MNHGRINSRIGDSKRITTRLTPRHDRSDSAVVGFQEAKEWKRINYAVMRRLFDLMLCMALKADSAGDSLQGQSFLPPPILAFAGLHI
jgi:hypothetical protein